MNAPWVSRGTYDWMVHSYEQRLHDAERDATAAVGRIRAEADHLRAELTEVRTQYHDLVLQSLDRAAPKAARVEEPQPEAEQHAKHAVRQETMQRLADHVAQAAATQGKTIDDRMAWAEAERILEQLDGTAVAGDFTYLET